MVQSAERSSATLVVGKESVGKSQVISSLTGRFAGESNYRGTTVTVQRYNCAGRVFVDTPGILRRSDTETTRSTLAALDTDDTVMLVVQATHLDDDLADMLPLLQGRRGIVVVSFWDKVNVSEAAGVALERLSSEAGVAFFPLDARKLSASQIDSIQRLLVEPGVFGKASLAGRAGWRIEPRSGALEHPVLGPVLAVTLLVAPALATIFGANALANLLNPWVAALTDPLIATVKNTWPSWARLVLTAEHGSFGYGLLNMGPFLLVWAFPTVLLFSVILGAYKASGLIERMNVALHPLVRPLGLSGRDVVRVMMGFGCNVPAVISTRACSGCSRGSAIAAIAFGAACSYQLPATLAVLAATASQTGRSPAVLALVFLAYLLATTILYLWLTAPATAKSSLNVLMTPPRPFMQWPRPGALWREAWGTIRQFMFQAMPIFVAICIIASLLAHAGAFGVSSHLLAPVMSLFNLPAEAALPVVMASIRKDGIFLFVSENGLAFPMSAAQVLTGVYMAGVLLPCLVTSITIARETSWRATGWLLLKQALFALAFSLILAWGGRWFL